MPVVPGSTTLTGSTFEIDLGSPSSFDSVTYTDSGSTGVLVSVLVNEHIFGDGTVYAFSYAGFAYTVDGVAYVPVGPFNEDPIDQPVTPDTYGQWWLTARSKRRYVKVSIFGGSPPYGSVSIGQGVPAPPPPPVPVGPVTPASRAPPRPLTCVGVYLFTVVPSPSRPS